MLDVPSPVLSQEPRPAPPKRDDIGYVLGWLCGASLLVGAIVAVVYLTQSSPRKAFQAIALPIAELAWVFGVLGLALWADPKAKSAAEAISVAIWFGGMALLPILGVYVLRKVSWPARKPSS
jgi:hypothetical protein